jgi:hypothetical protein
MLDNRVMGQQPEVLVPLNITPPNVLVETPFVTIPAYIDTL